MKAYTDIEQSKKLAEILPIESADMSYVLDIDNWEYHVDLGRFSSWVVPKYGETKIPQIFPCWSLAALLGVITKGEGKDLALVFGSYDGGYNPLWFCTYEETPTILEITSSDDPIDACVEMIYKLKEKDLL